ncbi:hypothetical protein PAMP_013767 [Pampus punctatissimus]
MPNPNRPTPMPNPNPNPSPIPPPTPTPHLNPQPMPRRNPRRQVKVEIHPLPKSVLDRLGPAEGTVPFAPSPHPPAPPTPSRPHRSVNNNSPEHTPTYSNVALPCSNTISSPSLSPDPPGYQQREPELPAAEPCENQTADEVDDKSMMMKGRRKTEMKSNPIPTSETSTSCRYRTLAAAPGSPGRGEPHIHPRTFRKLQDWSLEVSLAFISPGVTVVVLAGTFGGFAGVHILFEANVTEIADIICIYSIPYEHH